MAKAAMRQSGGQGEFESSAARENSPDSTFLGKCRLTTRRKSRSIQAFAGQRTKRRIQMLSAAQQIQASLSEYAAAGWDTVSLITKIVSVWRDIDVALAPVIGHRGIAALFGRSLHLTRADYPWLTAPHESTTDRIDFASLQSTLSQQTSANVVAVNGALLRKFAELLSNLIGVSLTERLLRPVVDIHSAGDAA